MFLLFVLVCQLLLFWTTSTTAKSASRLSIASSPNIRSSVSVADSSEEVLEEECLQASENIAILRKTKEDQAQIRFQNCTTVKVDVSEVDGKSVLDFSSTSLAFIEKIESYPDVQVLRFDYNPLKEFPVEDNSIVEELYLRNNRIVSFEDISMPSSLKTLDVSWNYIRNFKGFKPTGELEALYLGGNKLTTISDVVLPTTLRLLYLHDMEVSVTDALIPNSVKFLSLMSSNQTSLNGLKFPSDLEQLDVSQNQLQDLPWKDLPSGMTALRVQNNQLKELFNVTFPNSIVLLNLSANSITSIAGVRFPWTLKKLSLNGNPITKFEIARNDLQRFQSLEVFEASVDQSTCERSIAEKILVKGITLCVLDDKDFDVLYGKRAGGQMSSDDFSGSKSSFNWNIPVIIFAVIVVTVGAIFWGKNMLKSHNAKSKQQMPPALQGNYNHNNNTPSNDPSYALMSSSNVQMESLRRRNSGEDSLFGTLISSMMDSTFLKHRIPINDIQLQKVLAKGGNGIIYLAKHNRRLVVVKKILPEKAHEDSSLKSFLDEVRMCANLNHPKIVTFLGVSCTTIADVSVVIEYMPNGDLDMLLKRHHPSKGTNSSHEFDWFSRSPVLPSKVAIAVDVIEAVVYLHSFNNPIIHRDLKAKNVLLDDRYNAKLSDFGVSREFNMDATMTGGIGTVAWIAPEVLRGERYSEKADIYSYGVILSEMSTHEKPFDGVTNALVVLKVTSGEGRPCIAPDTPDKIRNLADRCLSFDPEERPSGMIVHHELRTLLKSQSSAVFI